MMHGQKNMKLLPVLNAMHLSRLQKNSSPD